MRDEPLSVGGILDAALRVLRGHFALLVGLGALVQVPLAFATAFATESSGGTPEFGLTSTLLMIVGAGLSLVVWPAQIHAVATLALGSAVGLDEAMGVGLRRLLAIVGTFLLLAIGMAVLFAPIAGLVFVVSSTLPEWLTAVLGGLAFGVWIYVGFRLAFVVEVVVLEQQAGWPALRRAFDLCGGHVLRVVAVTFLAAIVSSVPVAILQLLLADSPVANGVAVGLAQALAFTFTTAVAVLLYLDVRRRKGESPGSAAPAPEASPAPLY